MDETKQRNRVGVRDDIFTTPLYPSEQVRLKGCQCRVCGEVFLGKHLSCGNCANEEMGEIILGDKGKLWTYTIIRNRPPGDYKGPEPFVPFAEGLIELPEGIRVLSPLTGCDNDAIKIGTEWRLLVDVLYVDDGGNEVMSFKFKPV
jgi:uncharacterized protein